MKILTKSLTHHWRINLSVMLGAAVATAVLTGALLVGDSVRGSLRDLTLDRLGEIDHALVADRFFREDLARDLKDSPHFHDSYEKTAPAILITGTAVHSGSKTRAANVNILGLDNRFTNLFGGNSKDHDLSNLLKKQQNTPFATIVINASLQRELNTEIGDQILLTFEQQSDIHRESLFGKKESADLVRTLRLKLTHILPDEGIGRFGLRPHQNLPFNAYVSLAVLQNELQQTDKVNAIFVSARKTNNTSESDSALHNVLQNAVIFEDLGPKIQQKENYFALESTEFVLKAEVSQKAVAIAEKLHAPTQPVLTYLANSMSPIGKNKLLPYSTVTALDPSDDLGVLMLADGTNETALAENEILLNEWSAQDLDVEKGDQIELSYYTVGLRGELATDTASFAIRGILPIKGLAADRILAPDFPGISEADNMADWQPTFPVDLSLIRPKDEAYWDAYRATPKAFVSHQTGQKLWKSRFGDQTAIRIGAAPESDLQTTREKFEQEFMKAYPPAKAGLVFQPVKKQGLQASAGATDFGGLFIGMSLFLVVSAALLVGLLFRLGIERRANEIGVLLSSGYRVKQIRRMLYKESMIIAGAGCLLGLLGAILYSSIIMHGLRTWWLAAVGTPFLFLHVNAMSLGVGFLLAFSVVLFTIWRTVRLLGKVPIPALLAGMAGIETRKSGRFAKFVARISLGIALLLVFFSLFIGLEASTELFTFMGSGALLLVSGLAFFSIKLRNLRSTAAVSQSAIRSQQMAAHNTAVFPGRSMLCVALVACASFMIIAVGAFRRDLSEDIFNKSSGAGGFALLAESDIPLFANLNSGDERFDLGFNDRDSEILSGANILQFRLLPGEDASCLNLYKPEKPRVLGVPREQIERGGFTFQSLLMRDNASDNPWQLLNMDFGENVIPAFADYNSAMWILHLGLDKDVVLQNDFGQEIRLRLVGLLQKSIFQSELLISEQNFVRHFPSQAGFSYFLIETSQEKQSEASRAMEHALDDFGFDATPTAEKLANFQAVENTYIAVFQTLGGLGLLLGTVGLGIVLFRNAIERKKELATLRAFGFRRSRISSLLLSENSFLVILGIAIGAVAALIAIFPYIAAGDSQLPWFSLALTLLGVLIIGILASAIAVSLVLRMPLMPALKAE
ncbi:MAG: FtsX-like permease family protein [bacterium]